MKKLWISSPMATGQININHENIIIGTPPIWQKFYRAHYIRLISWLKNKFGDKLEVIEMKEWESSEDYDKKIQTSNS